VDATNLNKENPENAACKSGIFFFIFTRRSAFRAQAGSFTLTNFAEAHFARRRVRSL
jgi:hypothetical protein